MSTLKIAFPDDSQISLYSRSARIINRGIQLTFSDGQHVYQLAPSCHGEMTSESRRVLSRWILEDKAGLVAERTNDASRLAKSFSAVRVPVVTPLGRIIWQADFVYGAVTAETSLHAESHQTFSLLSQIVDFLAKLHDLRLGPLCGRLRDGYGFKTRLVEYYAQRLEDIALSLEEFSPVGKGAPLYPRDVLASVIITARKMVERVRSAICEWEMAVPIHGDANPGSNLLVGHDGMLHVIDFEQGLLGGDPLADLFSMRVLSDSIRISQLFSESQKRFLRNQYCRMTPYVNFPESMLASRARLIRFDRLASTLVLKIVEESVIPPQDGKRTTAVQVLRLITE